MPRNFLSSGVLLLLLMLCGSLSTCLAFWKTWCISEFRFGGDGDVGGGCDCVECMHGLSSFWHLWNSCYIQSSGVVAVVVVVILWLCASLSKFGHLRIHGGGGYVVGIRCKFGFGTFGKTIAH